MENTHAASAMTCPTCVTVWDESLRFCMECGRRLLESGADGGSPHRAPIELSHLCVNCYHVNAIVSLFCTSCGAHLQPANQPQTSQHQERQAPDPRADGSPQSPPVPPPAAEGVPPDSRPSAGAAEATHRDAATILDQLTAIEGPTEPTVLAWEAEDGGSLEPTIPRELLEEEATESMRRSAKPLVWEEPTSRQEGLVDERRTVTVMHADVCGFTHIAEQLTPEKTRALMDDLFQVMTREVQTHGGRVDAYIGDAVLAVFGHPISHLNDPQRAVNAALALQRSLAQFSHPTLAEMGIHLKVRIGLETGPVVVGRMGAAKRSTITGAAVASAMELEKAASPGAILVGAGTRNALPSGYLLSEQTEVGGRVAVEVRGRGAAPTRIPLEPRGAQNTPVDQAAPMDPAALSSEGSLELDRDENQRVVRAQAQLDSLPWEERRLLRIAAVVGSRFWGSLLERLGATQLERSLDALHRRGWIEPCSMPTLPGTLEYRFTSLEIQDVAYRGNLIKVRRFIHRVVASWLEARVGAELDFVPLLAQHLSLGGNPLGAAQVWYAAGGHYAELRVPEKARSMYQHALQALDLELADSAEARAFHTRCLAALDGSATGSSEAS